METHKQVYIAIDLHSKNSCVGYMNDTGKYINQQTLPTTARHLTGAVARVPACHKSLTIEQGNMAFWAANTLAPLVDELIVCDPRENALISRSTCKNDSLDTYRLCKLLRLGELKSVWCPEQLGQRRLFFHQIKEYRRLRKMLTTNKRQLISTLRHWGYNLSLSPGDYRNFSEVVAGIDPEGLRREVRAKFELIAIIARQKNRQRERYERHGSAYWEIAEFQKMPGVGPVGAHTFSAYVQSPHRFSNRGELISFCKLGVRSSRSDGRRLRSERLSKAGYGCLKEVSHRAWKAARTGDNEVNRFYQDSLKRCDGNEVHARLNTQRKILKTLWSLWKNKQTYQPEKFYSETGDSAQ